MTWPVCLNDNGQVAGTLDDLRDGARLFLHNEAFLWDRGRLTQLPALPGCIDTRVTAINAQGQVVGFSSPDAWPPDADVRPHAVIWTQGRIRDLGEGEAQAVNDLGDVIGGSTLWHLGQAVHLHGLGGEKDAERAINACAINNRGLMVGDAMTPDHFMHAVQWHNGRITRLKELGMEQSHAHAVNDRGEIVGDLISAQRKSFMAAFWQNGKVYPLDSLLKRLSGWHFDSAYFINQKGWILADGERYGQNYCVLLKPYRGRARYR